MSVETSWHQCPSLLVPSVRWLDCGAEAANWLEQALQRTCRLVRQHPDSLRTARKQPGGCGSLVGVATGVAGCDTVSLSLSPSLPSAPSAAPTSLPPAFRPLCPLPPAPSAPCLPPPLPLPSVDSPVSLSLVNEAQFLLVTRESVAQLLADLGQADDDAVSSFPSAFSLHSVALHLSLAISGRTFGTLSSQLGNLWRPSLCRRYVGGARMY